MLHVLILHYTTSPDKAAPHVPGHVDYLERHHAQGVFVFSGQTEPVEKGEVILARGERSRVEEITAEDPFVQSGVAAYEIVSALPGRLHPGLAELLGPVEPDGDSAATREAWTFEEYLRLRADAPDLAAILTGRPLDAVLQRAGTALLGGLRAGSPGIAEVARRCVTGLRERDWEGDDLISDELAQALDGQTDPAELAPVPVDLEELADALDGDPSEGDGVLDLRTGEVWPGALVAIEPPPGLADDDTYDPERWLALSPDSHSAYQDMADFAGTVADTWLRERLLRSLQGRGAFRRFKDVIHDTRGSDLDAWTIFRQERALGLARRWLAEQGCRPVDRSRQPAARSEKALSRRPDH
jgi:uncharacterized protein YciI